MKRTILNLSIFLSLIFMSGCASFQSQESDSLERSALVWLNQSMSIEVDEVKASDHELYLKFTAFIKDTDQVQVFQARSIWEAEEDFHKDKEKLFLLDMEFIPFQLYQLKSQLLDSVKVLETDHWYKIRENLVVSLLKDGPQKALQISLNGDAYVLFEDSEGYPQIVPLNEKNKTLHIDKILTEGELEKELLRICEDYIKQVNLEEKKFLISTSQDDGMIQAFLYVDLESKMVLQLKFNDQAEQRYRKWLIQKGWKSADQLIINTYVLGMPTRPLSSAYRLFSWTKGTAYEAFRPDKGFPFEDKTIQPIFEGPGMDLDAWETRLDKLIGKNDNAGTMEYLIGGGEYFPDQINAFLNAKESILVRIFIFDNDDYAVKVADILKKKSNEGIKVKVLLDGMGVVMGEGKQSATLPPGFNPPSSMVKYLQKDSNIEVRVRPNAWFKADHTKTVIIDEKVCYTGGMNFGREYRYDWHDMMMRVNGSILNEILVEFDLAWEHAGRLGDLGYLKSRLNRREKIEADDGYPIRLLYTRINDAQIYKAQLEAIKNSQKYIYISNAYFSDNMIIQELVRARRRGVDVRVILPVHGNHEIMNKNNVVKANYLFKSGIRVFFYPGMSHIKAAVYDGWLCTGSANFDKLSFRDNLELNVASSDPEAVKGFLEQLFYPDFEKSTEMIKLLDYGIKERLAELIANQL